MGESWAQSDQLKTSASDADIAHAQRQRRTIVDFVDDHFNYPVQAGRFGLYVGCHFVSRRAMKQIIKIWQEQEHG